MKTNPGFCAYCGEELDMGREFVYQFEATELESELGGSLSEIPINLQVDAPLRVCKKCQASIEQNEAELTEPQMPVMANLYVRILLAILFLLLLIQVLKPLMGR